MPETNLHLLRGDDRFSIGLRIAGITRSLGPGFDPSMNTTRLDGKSAGLDELHQAVSTLPFFGAYRLVILESALGMAEKGKQEKFIGMLETMPPSTQLLLLVEDHQRWRKDPAGDWTRTWETLHPGHWLVKWFNTHENAGIIDLPLPDEKEMDAWVIAETKRQGGAIEPEAARELGRHTGNDTSIASQEISKLLTYVDFKRPVTTADVLELVSVEGSADVFIMLDKFMEGKTREAQSMMHRLLDDTPPEVILGAVVHRVRQLIQVREALDEGRSLKELADKKVIFYSQVDRYTAAARRFTMDQLESMYRHLLEVDLQAKTSHGDLATNLELLVLETSNNF